MSADDLDEDWAMMKRQSRARIAVVDDNVVLARLAGTLLAEEGFEVLVCSNWLEAHALVVVEEPDLVLLDVTLGDGDYGWQVLDHLKLDPSTRRTPVILWSGEHEALHARAYAPFAEHGIFVMTKPFEFDALLATVEDALRQYPPLLRLAARTRSDDVVADGDLKRLTDREQEVARLIARGYSNRQIADALVLTTGTVANHVARILEKLECSSRVQIATRTLDRESRLRAANQEDSGRLLA